MTFDYNTLKRAAKDGLRLGSWNGKAVFATPSSRLDNLGSGAYYILYDDENKIVAKTSNGWKSYGEVSESGSVNEYSSARNYKTPAEAAAAARKASSAAWPQTSGMRSAGKNTGSASSITSYLRKSPRRKIFLEGSGKFARRSSLVSTSWMLFANLLLMFARTEPV